MLLHFTKFCRYKHCIASIFALYFMTYCLDFFTVTWTNKFISLTSLFFFKISFWLLSVPRRLASLAVCRFCCCFFLFFHFTGRKRNKHDYHNTGQTHQTKFRNFVIFEILWQYYTTAYVTGLVTELVICKVVDFFLFLCSLPILVIHIYEKLTCFKQYL